MNVTKHYPEAHATWLHAMGIDTRWHLRAQTDATRVDVVLPEAVMQARCWVQGDGALTSEQAFLLAGMLWAVGLEPQQVIYTHHQGEVGTGQTMATGLSAWAHLETLVVDAGVYDGHVEATADVLVWVLGGQRSEETPHNHLCLPRLQEMLDEPSLKKQAWDVLKLVQH